MKNKNEVTTNDIMGILLKMQIEIKEMRSQMATKNDIARLDQRIDKLDRKFEDKFDLLFDTVGELNEKFTLIDYKYIQLKRQVHAT